MIRPPRSTSSPRRRGPASPSGPRPTQRRGRVNNDDPMPAWDRDTLGAAPRHLAPAERSPASTGSTPRLRGAWMRRCHATLRFGFSSVDRSGARCGHRGGDLVGRRQRLTDRAPVHPVPVRQAPDGQLLPQGIPTDRLEQLHSRPHQSGPPAPHADNDAGRVKVGPLQRIWPTFRDRLGSLSRDGWEVSLARRTRLRSSSKPARPYICRLIILMRFTDPSTAPELCFQSEAVEHGVVVTTDPR